MIKINFFVEEPNSNICGAASSLSSDDNESDKNSSYTCN